MMNDDRVIGRLEEFKEWAKEEFDSINTQLEKINKDRFILYGKLAVLNSIIMLALENFFRHLK